MMAENSDRLQQKLKIAAYLLIAGLIIGAGGTLIALGIIVYLIAIVAT
jgi:hypothetical protein